MLASEFKCLVEVEELSGERRGLLRDEAYDQTHILEPVQASLVRSTAEADRGRVGLPFVPRRSFAWAEADAAQTGYAQYGGRFVLCF